MCLFASRKILHMKIAVSAGINRPAPLHPVVSQPLHGFRKCDFVLESQLGALFEDLGGHCLISNVSLFDSSGPGPV